MRVRQRSIGNGLGVIGNGVFQFEHMMLRTEFGIDRFRCSRRFVALDGGGGGLDGELEEV